MPTTMIQKIFSQYLRCCISIATPIVTSFNDDTKVIEFFVIQEPEVLSLFMKQHPYDNVG
jgi:hypothetical protein